MEHIIIFVCAGGGMEIVKLPQAANQAAGDLGGGGYRPSTGRTADRQRIVARR